MWGEVIKRLDLELRPVSEISSKFKEFYIPNLVGSYWEGNESDCSIGTHSPIDRDDALRRIKFFRYMAGLSIDVIFNSAYDQECGEAAAYLFANDELDHTPQSSKPCYTKLAYQAASSSNLAMGRNAAGSIEMYIHDNGVDSLGHRRWILLPSAIEFGIGQKRYFNVLKVFYTTRNDNLTAPFVAHPGPGPQIYNLIPHAWSFQLSSISEDISVVVKRADGLNVDITYGYPSSFYGWDCISFIPTDKSQIETGYEYKIDVTVGNKSYQYITYFVRYNSILKDFEIPELKRFETEKKINKGASAGIIIGVVLGCLLIVAVIIIIVFVIRRKRNSESLVSNEPKGVCLLFVKGILISCFFICLL
jgi:hypothetical protein